MSVGGLWGEPDSEAGAEEGVWGPEEPHLAGMEASHVGASWAVRVGR